MKVSFDKKDKKYFTMAEAPIVNALIKEMKSSEDTIEDAVRYAMQALDEYDIREIFRAEAKIYHNGRIWNYYNNESGTIDIWIDAVVKTEDRFYIIGFYLSDAWSVGADNHDKISYYIYVEKYVEEEK